MKAVVDASVAVKWYFREREAREATRILEERNDGVRVLLAPDWIVAELAKHPLQEGPPG